MLALCTDVAATHPQEVGTPSPQHCELRPCASAGVWAASSRPWGPLSCGRGLMERTAVTCRLAGGWAAGRGTWTGPGDLQRAAATGHEAGCGDAGCRGLSWDGLSWDVPSSRDLEMAPSWVPLAAAPSCAKPLASPVCPGSSWARTLSPQGTRGGRRGPRRMREDMPLHSW